MQREEVALVRKASVSTIRTALQCCCSDGSGSDSRSRLAYPECKAVSHLTSSCSVYPVFMLETLLPSSPGTFNS
jgi:hypothetical protein